jgi:prophage antirepressor-like protein
MKIEKLFENKKAIVTADLSKKSDGETKYIRTLKIEEKEFFVAKDIAELLGYNEPHKAITKHCKKATNLKSILNRDNLSLLENFKSLGSRWASIKLIQEGDIWRLIIKSRLPEAEKIEDWIMEEVLPTIRKDGFYISPNADLERLFFAKEKLNETIEETRYSLDLVKEEFRKSVIDFLKDDENFKSDKERAGVLGYLTDSIYLVANLKTASSKKQDYLLERERFSLKTTNQLRKDPEKRLFSDNFSAINMMSQEELSAVKTVYLYLMDGIRTVKKHRFSEKSAPVLRKFITGILLEIFKTIPEETVQKYGQFYTVDTENLNYIIRKVIENCFVTSDFHEEIERLSTRERKL